MADDLLATALIADFDPRIQLWTALLGRGFRLSLLRNHDM